MDMHYTIRHEEKREQIKYLKQAQAFFKSVIVVYYL